MPIHQLDVLIRVSGATLLILVMLSFRGRLTAPRAYFIPMAICLCGFLAGNSPDPRLQLAGPMATVAYIATGYAAVFLWWFALAVFDARFRPQGLVLATGVAWIIIASADRGLIGDRFEQAGLSRVLVVLGLCMIAHLTWRVLRDREGDLLDHRRRVRHVVVIALGVQLLADVAVDLFMGFDWQPQTFSILQNAALLAFTGWLLSLTRPRDAREFPQHAVIEPQPEAPGNAALARLRHLMDVERVHLQPDLTFDDFVRAMGASERTVRELINHQLGHEHFRNFLNTFRVAEARRILADPTRRADKLIAVAFDSGFSSLPTFNRAFREIEGQSPGAFREAALATPVAPIDRGANAASMQPETVF